MSRARWWRPEPNRRPAVRSRVRPVSRRRKADDQVVDAFGLGYDIGRRDERKRSEQRDEQLRQLADACGDPEALAALSRKWGLDDDDQLEPPPGMTVDEWAADGIEDLEIRLSAGKYPCVPWCAIPHAAAGDLVKVTPLDLVKVCESAPREVHTLTNQVIDVRLIRVVDLVGGQVFAPEVQVTIRDQRGVEDSDTVTVKDARRLAAGLLAAADVAGMDESAVDGMVAELLADLEDE